MKVSIYEWEKQKIHDMGYCISDLSKLIPDSKGRLGNKTYLSQCFHKGLIEQKSKEKLDVLMNVRPTPVDVNKYANEINAPYVSGNKLITYYLKEDGTFRNKDGDQYDFSDDKWKQTVDAWKYRYIHMHVREVVETLEAKIEELFDKTDKDAVLKCPVCGRWNMVRYLYNKWVTGTCHFCKDNLVDYLPEKPSPWDTYDPSAKPKYAEKEG